MLRRKIMIGLILAILLATMVSTAFAGSTNFNVVVPKLGGQANTNTTTKNTNVQQWAFGNLVVGADKSVNFTSMKNGGTQVGNWISGTTGSNINAPYTSTQNPGTLINGKIGTNWTEVVNVQVSGWFDSN